MKEDKKELPDTTKNASEGQDRSDPVRVREFFPETLLWRPEIITDDNGKASLDVDLADSITTWRVAASAVSADGRLGAMQTPLRVFQPFFVDLNLPVALTRGDEAAVPAVVYNYLDKPQTVELTLDNADWFDRLDGAVQKIELAAGEVKSASYRLRVTKVGNQKLQVTARGSGVADALIKEIEVVPDGRRVEQTWNGTLGSAANLTLMIPADAIPGSAKAVVKIYPSSFSQLVEGLDNIFRMPYGCFEQTSSTVYPNVLALDYLRRTNKTVPAVEAKARQYIHLGYQRLLGFEVNGGGFDWFGRPPANVTLTAYGLMEFEAMSTVHDVPLGLLMRTRHWLMVRRQADGSWNSDSGLHETGFRGRGRDDGRLATTAYVAWAIYGGGGWSDAEPTRAYLLSHKPESIDDAHTLALVANALLSMDPTGAIAAGYLERLHTMKHAAEDGKKVWWEQSANGYTTFYGRGRSGSIETTSLAALAFLKSNLHPETVRSALTWIAEQKDPHGTWHSTQATVLALKALVAGTGKPLGGERERQIEIKLGGDPRSLTFTPLESDVMKQMEFSTELHPGQATLTLTDLSGTAAAYQVAFRYHLPDDGKTDKQEPLAISLSYDRTDLSVGGTAKATAVIENRMNQTAPMVMLDLPIPAGFAVEADDFTKLVQAGTIAKFQVTGRTVLVYLRGLQRSKPLKLEYSLKATMPVKLTVPAARAYEYYDPSKQGRSRPVKVKVSAN